MTMAGAGASSGSSNDSTLRRRIVHPPASSNPQQTPAPANSVTAAAVAQDDPGNTEQYQGWLPDLDSRWLLALPGQGLEAAFGKQYVSQMFVQDVLVLLLELLLVASSINLRLMQQLACQASPAPASSISAAAATVALTAVGPKSTLCPVSNAVHDKLEHIAQERPFQPTPLPQGRQQQQQQLPNKVRPSAAPHNTPSSQAAVSAPSCQTVEGGPVVATGSDIQQQFREWLQQRIEAPGTWAFDKHLLRGLQRALPTFPCPANFPQSEAATATATATAAAAAAAAGDTGHAKGQGPANSSKQSRNNRRLQCRQMKWVFQHLYQVNYVTQAFAKDWSFILWSIQIHIGLIVRLMVTRWYLHHPWVRTLLVVATRFSMMAGHIVTLQWLRSGHVPALGLTTTMYYSLDRRRLGLLYVVWKAAGISKVPCKHQLWFGVVEFILTIMTMVQVDVATEGRLQLGSYGVAATWLLVYVMPLVLVLRAEGRARAQMMLREQTANMT